MNDLPTQPYTVIRVTWPYGVEDWMLTEAGHWITVFSGAPIHPSTVAAVARFEVLSVPLSVEDRDLIREALEGYDWEGQALRARAFIESNFMPGPNGDRIIAEAELKPGLALALAARIAPNQNGHNA